MTRNKQGSSANLPMDQYGMYIQDDWRVNDRLTINAGLRYDLVTGFKLDQSGIPNFVTLQAAARAGRFTNAPGFDEFGPEPAEDTNNIQPRIGAVYDLRGNGKDIVRAGWGIYYDFGYTNANILFPGLSVQGGSGVVFQATNTAGLRNPNGTFFTVNDPVTNIAALNEVNPAGPFFSTNLTGADRAAAVYQPDVRGWSHELTSSTVIDVDYVHVAGRTSASGGRSTRCSASASRGATPTSSSTRPTRRSTSTSARAPTTASTSACAGAWTRTCS